MTLRTIGKIFKSLKSVAIIVLIIFGVLALRGGVNAFFSKMRHEIDRSVSSEVANIKSAFVAYDDKELKKSIKQLLKEADARHDKRYKELIAKIKKQDEEIEGIGKISAEFIERSKPPQPSDHEYKVGTDSPQARATIIIDAKDTDGDEFPIGYAQYRPNKDKDKRWKQGVRDFGIGVNVIETQTKDDEWKQYVDVYATSTHTEKGVHPLPVGDVSWTRKKRTEKEWMWNPRIAFTGAVLESDIMPGLDLSLWSYGRTKADMDWRFFGIGIGATSDDWWGYFFPVEYNVANHLPLVKNIFMGPFVGANADDQEIKWGVGGSVPF